jgi:hypothetical protein
MRNRLGWSERMATARAAAIETPRDRAASLPSWPPAWVSARVSAWASARRYIARPCIRPFWTAAH